MIKKVARAGLLTMVAGGLGLSAASSVAADGPIACMDDKDAPGCPHDDDGGGDFDHLWTVWRYLDKNTALNISYYGYLPYGPVNPTDTSMLQGFTGKNCTVIPGSSPIFGIPVVQCR